MNEPMVIGCHQCCVEISVIRSNKYRESQAGFSNCCIVCAPLADLETALVGGDLHCCQHHSLRMLLTGACNCSPVAVSLAVGRLSQLY